MFAPCRSGRARRTRDERYTRTSALSDVALLTTKGAPLMILVVDDDLAFLQQAQKTLNRNRQVFLASTSQHAFDLARNLGFAVALVDLNMRGMEGLDLIRKLHTTVPDLPIIAICGDVQGVLADNLRALGVVEFLQKPITPAWKPVVERIRATRAGTA